ncbi:MAG: hypothetical protein FWG10_13750 [Eubacteriaceae bacterium]|nr:hypothetical protein [Eubacteriaceae bacterium]
MALTPKENLALIYQKKEPEYMPLNIDSQMIRTPGAGLRTVVYDGKPAQQFSQQDGGLDWFGQNWIYEPKVNAINPDANNYLIKDVANWRDYVTLPDVDAIDWNARFEKEAIPIDETKMLQVSDSIGMWERGFSSVRIDDLLTGLLLEPEAMFDFFSTIADHKIKLFGYYIDYYKPDILRMNDDYGHGTGLFMSPDTWREIIKPNLKKIIDSVTSKGVMYEHHCCGYLVPLVEEIAELGATSWNGMHICNDPGACRQMFNDTIVVNGTVLDTQFLDSPLATEESIRAHIREMMGKVWPGNFIISGNATVHTDRNAIILDEMLKSGQQYFNNKRPDFPDYH